MKLFKEVSELNDMEVSANELSSSNPLKDPQVIKIVVKILQIAKIFTNAKIDAVIDIVISFLENKE